ncbi:MAG: ATP-binding protein [Ardenticatenaceae bacterium]|nr:ATP-binding protein [Anaerolineales bacterium]MCB8921954.1 ATP-binding protein [Ardenticatenaceae bacterium]MCB8989530.1 ATP-binding protein [Ardenticatenaceae bacterium]MCB9003073.1 ATP-binding protein [Ardenticatenaceae bacterium]
MGNKHILTVPGRYDQIRKVVTFVAEGAGEAGLDEDAVFHVELCCDEACTNIIEHAYGGENQGKITVSYEAAADSFTITLQDNGHSFNPQAIPPPPLPPVQPTADLTSEEIIKNLKIGGLGIHFMRKLMDEVHFSFETNGGNTLVMVKKLSPRGK